MLGEGSEKSRIPQQDFRQEKQDNKLAPQRSYVRSDTNANAPAAVVPPVATLKVSWSLHVRRPLKREGYHLPGCWLESATH